MRTHFTLRFLIFLVGFNFISFHTFGQEDSIKTAFWRVISSDLKDTSYLLGTNHICMSSYFEINKDILKKLNESKMFAAEAIFKKSITKTNSQKVISHSWFELATDSQRVNILNFYKVSLSYSENEIKNHDILYLKNDFQYHMGYLISEQLTGIKSQYFMDDYLRFLCKKDGRKMVGLESDKEHYEYLNLLFSFENSQKGFDTKGNINLVDSLINIYKINKSSLLEEYSERVSYYNNNNIYYSFADTSKFPIENILLKHRNLVWLPNIVKLIKTRKTFIAVGLNHLRYKYGLIQLLREYGYKVEPVFNNI